MDGSATIADEVAPAAPLPAALRLHCLGGGGAPPDLGADLRRLLALPAPALMRFWQVLGPALAETLSPETARLLDVFTSAYALDGQSLALAVKACRFLVREAAARDLPAAALAEDLGRLCGDAPGVGEILLAGYEPAREQIRRDILRAALADHGKVLVGARWRVDRIQACERGARIGAPVALLTLSYCEGPARKRLTLQVLPDMVGELKGICESILT